MQVSKEIFEIINKRGVKIGIMRGGGGGWGGGKKNKY